MHFPGGSVVNNPPANAGDAGDAGSIPGSGRSPGEGNGNPLEYSCLENPMEREAWRTTFHGVTKSRIQLSRHTHTQGIQHLVKVFTQVFTSTKLLKIILKFMD